MPWLLWAACAAPTPTLPLGALSPATAAAPLPADRLLTPTPFGATGDLLCPWARGEPVPDASLARWLAEARLTWRVLDAESGTYGGRPLAEAPALAEAARSLDERCAAARPADVLVLARGGTPNHAVHRAVAALAAVGPGPLWVAVADGAPAEPAEPAAVGGAPTVVTLSATAPPSARAAGGAALEPAAALAAAPDCALVVSLPGGSWGGVVPLLDAAHRAGAGVLLAVGDEPGPPAPVTALDVAVAPVPLHGVVSALPLVVPASCGGGGAGCGCAPLPLLEVAAPPSP